VSIESLDREIAQARAEFTRLNSGRHNQGFWRELPPKVEALLVECCDRMARLYRFKSELFARNYALDGTRGIEFS